MSTIYNCELLFLSQDSIQPSRTVLRYKSDLNFIMFSNSAKNDNIVSVLKTQKALESSFLSEEIFSYFHNNEMLI